jgi:peptidoglycan/LPS O-acetylase OafA/YrhL
VSPGPADPVLPERPPGTFGGGRAPILELDGVRGLAILLVMLFHFQGTRPHLVPKALVYPMIVGWSGVDLFFVLSGFLITGILIDTRDSENYFSSFYARRVLRIVPLYLIAVFLCFRIALPLARRWGVDLDPDGSLEPWYWLHVSNWRSAFGRDVRPLSHFWSLSIEEQFYLVWPAFVLWTKPRRLGAACAALAVTACVLRCLAAARGVPPEALHRLTVFRIDALAIGGLLAAVGRSAPGREWIRRRLRSGCALVGAALVALLVAGRGATSPPMVRLGYTVFALLYAGLVFAAFDGAGSPGWLCRQLRRPTLRAFGRYSYAMYVFHYPISVYQALVFEEWSRSASEPIRALLWLASVLFGIAASFAVGLLSWNLLEKHFLALKRYFVARAPAVGGA